MDDPVVRGSVSNRAPRLVVKETGEVKYFGVLYPPAFKQGRFRFVSVGGGAKMSHESQAILRNKFPEIRFTQGLDARFAIPASSMDAVLAEFRRHGDWFAETDPRREFLEELAQEVYHPLCDTILAPTHAKEITARFVSHAVQPEEGFFSSIREPEMHIRRFMRLYELLVSQEVYDALRRSPAVWMCDDPLLLPGAQEDGARVLRDDTRPGGQVEVASNIFVF